MENVAFVEPYLFIDVDETASSPEQFEEKYGWSEIGDPCVYTQLVIGNKHYTAIAAYCIYGFLGWAIVEGSVDAEQFILFVDDTLCPLILPGHYGLIDNAKIHKTDESLHSLNTAFHGLFLDTALTTNLSKKDSLMLNGS